MNGIEEIKHNLDLLKACDMAHGISGFKDAVDILFTPQGREFFMNTGYPSHQELIAHYSDLADIPGMFIDCGNVILKHTPDNMANLLVSGNSQVKLRISKPTVLHRIVVAHNASVELNVGEYAVATITIVGECEVNVINDGTAKVTIERKHHG